MKKYKGLLLMLAIAIIVSTLVACSSQSKYVDQKVELTIAVTDSNGEAVTDSKGEIATETLSEVVATNKKGETVTEVVTDSKGEPVTNAKGEKVTQAVTADSSKQEDKTTKKSEKISNKADKTTKTGDTTKAEKTTKPTTEKTTVTTTIPSTAKDEEYDEKDPVMYVVLPFKSVEDANNYTLYVTIEGDAEKKEKDVVLKYPITEGCRGQQYKITMPKKYLDKSATFSVKVKEQDYSKKAKIKDKGKVMLQTIVVVEGEDD